MFSGIVAGVSFAVGLTTVMLVVVLPLVSLVLALVLSLTILELELLTLVLLEETLLFWVPSVVLVLLAIRLSKKLLGRVLSIMTKCMLEEGEEDDPPPDVLLPLLIDLLGEFMLLFGTGFTTAGLGVITGGSGMTTGVITMF